MLRLRYGPILGFPRGSPPPVKASEDRMRTQAAIADIAGGARAWRFWTMLGWNDIKQRYRRTLIGPFWITISMSIMILALGVIYAAIFNATLSTYLLYLAAGMVVWFFVSSTILEGTSAFVASEGIIKQSPIPLTIYIYRVIWRNIIILLHNSVVVAVMYPLMPSFSALSVLALGVGLVIIVANLFVMSLILALLSTRFRDLPPIVTSITQVLFYVTPVLYEPSQLPKRLQVIAHYNPFYHIIDVLRQPMIGALPDPESYAVGIGMFLIGGLVAFLLFRRFRARVAYWL